MPVVIRDPKSVDHQSKPSCTIVKRRQPTPPFSNLIGQENHVANGPFPPDHASRRQRPSNRAEDSSGKVVSLCL